MTQYVDFGVEFRNQRFNQAGLGLKAFAQSLGKSVEVVGPVLRAEIELMLKTISAAMQQRHSTPWSAGGSPKDRLYRRSGKGLKSIADSVQVTGNTLETVQGRISVGFPMSVHEKGATIKPKKAKYLAIPLPAALTPQGLPIKPKPRDWKNTFVAKSRKGNLLIFQRVGKKITPLYVLRKSVKLPPRLGMRATIDKAIPFFVDRSMNAMAKELLKK